MTATMETEPTIDVAAVERRAAERMRARILDALLVAGQTADDFSQPGLMEAYRLIRKLPRE